jgi:hypothetical protein
LTILLLLLCLSSNFCTSDWKKLHNHGWCTSSWSGRVSSAQKKIKKVWNLAELYKCMKSFHPDTIKSMIRQDEHPWWKYRCGAEITNDSRFQCPFLCSNLSVQSEEISISEEKILIQQQKLLKNHSLSTSVHGLHKISCYFLLLQIMWWCVL